MNEGADVATIETYPEFLGRFVDALQALPSPERLDQFVGWWQVHCPPEWKETFAADSAVALALWDSRGNGALESLGEDVSPEVVER